MKIKHHTSKLVFLFFIISVVSSYSQINQKREYMAFLEQHSTYPLFHVFYNRHFKKSRQFEDFLQVVQDVETKVKQFARIIFTDCDEALGQGFTQCQQIMDNNQNRFIVGLKPNSNFLSLSGKLLQRNPNEVKYNHPLDVYTVTQLVQFIQGLVPSYLIDVVSNEEYQQFLKPRYSTKALYFTKQDDVPLNIKKLSTIFHLKLDFARVEDLSEDIIARHRIIHFPTLLILKYNYTKFQFDEFKYSGPHFDVQGYLKMKAFLQSHAMTQSRNDLLFHSIKMETNNSIIKVKSHQQKQQQLDKVSGLVWIEQSPSMKFLPELQQKYTNFFNYIHVRNPDINDTYMHLYNTEHRRIEQQTENQFPHLQFLGLDIQPLLSNISFYMHRNYSVLIVPKKYGYFCTIIHKRFFEGITNCFIGNPDAIQQLKKQTGEFQFGIAAYQTPGMEKKRFTGSQIKNANYQSVYRALQQAVKVKLDSQIKNFLQSPVMDFKQRSTILQMCADPRRKCVIAFLDRTKSIAFKTEQGYLKDIAQQYYSDYRIFWVDIQCNKNFLDSINEPKATLLVIDPIKGKYQALKQRITKSIMVKFLKGVKVNSKKQKALEMSAIINECLDENQEL